MMAVPTKYYYGVPQRVLTCDEVIRLLERFPVERAGGRTLEEVADSDVQALLARIAALTDLLRDAEPDDTARLASRMLLIDLATLAAYYRGRANSMKQVLSKTLAELGDARATISRERG